MVVSPRRPAVEDVLVGHALPEVAKRIFIEIASLGVYAIEFRGQSFAAQQAVFHHSAELICAHMHISRATLYRNLRPLVKCGLISHRAHYSGWFRLTRATGTIFAVSLKPGHRAVLRHEDKAFAWRDLASDIDRGFTAWAAMQQSTSIKPVEISLENLQAWIRCPGRVETPLRDCHMPDGGTLRDLIYTLPDVENQRGKQKDELITRLAQALAAGFLDQSNFRFWTNLLYRANETGHLGTLKHALTRLLTDLAEWPGLQRPGALLVARLKLAGIWDDLQI